MPLYEYTCEDCGERFERLIRSAASTNAIVCPRCTSIAVRRAFSTFATSGGAGQGDQACGPVG